MVASSFGKLVMKENPNDGIDEEDLALALLMMITNNIGQVAYLNAQLNNCSKVFFVGSFLRHNPISCRRLAFAIEFWSSGKMEALFLSHEGYFGALGTFLQSAYGDEVDKILYENEKQTTQSILPFSQDRKDGRGSMELKEKEVSISDKYHSTRKTTIKSLDAYDLDWKDFKQRRKESLNQQQLQQQLEGKEGGQSLEDDQASDLFNRIQMPPRIKRGRSVSDDITHRVVGFSSPLSPIPLNSSNSSNNNK
jgi:hypothetical protein